MNKKKNKPFRFLIIYLLLSIIVINSPGTYVNKMLYGRFIIKNESWYIVNNNTSIKLLKPPNSYLKKINFKPEILNNKNIYIIGYCFDKDVLRPHIIQYESYNYVFEDDNHQLLWMDQIKHDDKNNNKVKPGNK